VLAALVLAGILAAPAGTAALLVGFGHPRRTSGAWPAVRRFAFAISGTPCLPPIHSAMTEVSTPAVKLLGSAAIAAFGRCAVPGRPGSAGCGGG
jgi:hypothetical protein